MASVTITQVQLLTGITNNSPSSLYWNTNTEKEMSIDPLSIVAVGYVFDTFQKNYIPGIVQIFFSGIMAPIYSSNSYESIVAYMNP